MPSNFVGEFPQVIDEKHRLTINSALREDLDAASDGENFILLLGPDKHLWLYPEKVFQKIAAKMRSAGLPTRNSRKTGLISPLARKVNMDGQGRIVIPDQSMQRATISENVVLIGETDHLEIWPQDEWERHVNKTLPGYGDAWYEAAEQVQQQESSRPE